MIEPNRIRLLLGGDVMLGRGVNEVIHREGPEYPFRSILTITRSSDLSFANLECAITPHLIVYSGPQKAFYFRADPITVETLLHAGINLVSLANNHTLDADIQGLRDSLELLERAGILAVGAGENLEAAGRPAIIELNGVRLGVLAYCDHQADFAAGHNQPGIRYVDLSDPTVPASLAVEVEYLASRVNHVIIAFHWQPNWVHQVPKFYRSLAGLLIEAGASLVWGHSPHHFLGVEWFGNRPALYSTGGLLDDYALDEKFRNDRQLLFQVTLGKGEVESLLVYPIELLYAQTISAGEQARKWIHNRFEYLCSEVGSRVEIQDDWLAVFPG